MNKDNFVNRLINSLLDEFQRNDRRGIYALTQRKMAYNSNKIEGSTLTERQTASIFDTGTIRADNEYTNKRCRRNYRSFYDV